VEQNIEGINNLKDLLALFGTPPEFNLQPIYDLICPMPGSEVPENVVNLLNFTVSPDFQNPICDDDLLNEALEQAKIYIQTFYNLTSHDQFCRYVKLIHAVS